MMPMQRDLRNYNFNRRSSIWMAGFAGESGESGKRRNRFSAKSNELKLPRYSVKVGLREFPRKKYSCTSIGKPHVQLGCCRYTRKGCNPQHSTKMVSDLRYYESASLGGPVLIMRQYRPMPTKFPR